MVGRTNKSRIRLSDARDISEPVVYALSRPDGEFVYVGMTRSPHGRFYAYQNPDKCHNKKLAEWLSRGDCMVTILHTGESGLLVAEKNAIRRYRTQLFNLVGGGDQNWREHDSKPWMGKTGLHCPSAIMLRYLSRAGHDGYDKIRAAVDDARDGMDDLQRSNFEVALARECMGWPMLRSRAEKWLNLTQDKLMVALNRHEQVYGEQG